MGGDPAVWSSVPQDRTPLVRTDFSSDHLWQRLVAAIATPSPDGFIAYLHLIENRMFDGADPHALCHDLRSAADVALLIVADRLTMTSDEMPLLCLSIFEQEASLRVVPSELWAIENNISIANADFDDFVRSADADGIYRGN